MQNTDRAAPLAHEIRQAGERLGGLGKTTMFALIKAGELRSIKIGARTLIPESELQRFINERLKRAAA